MPTIHELETQREQILTEMRSIRSMWRGSISTQHLKSAPTARRSTPVIHGPYYVLSRRQGNRTVSRRLTSARDLDQARQDVATHKRFVALCEQFERLTEQLGELERAQPALGQEKKRRRSRSNRTKK